MITFGGRGREDRAARGGVRGLVAGGIVVLGLIVAPGGALAAPATIATNRVWDALPAPAAEGARHTLRRAVSVLGDAPLTLAGVTLDQALLHDLGTVATDEPLVRAVRERIGQAVDLGDFLLFLDDVARARRGALGAAPVHVHSGRARGSGILLHPDDVFEQRPRRYGGRPLAITPPAEPAALEPAPDGAPLGARWTARFPNPDTEAAMLTALARANPGSFDDRIRALLAQFRAQGAQTYVFSTLRRRERGYLMYGAFILSRAPDAGAVAQRVETLERLNREWGLRIPIEWRHPDGWRATVAAAAEMAAAYNVVYATRSGARRSSHYEGHAVDLAVVDLPRTVTLTAPDGATREFDLAAAGQPRDLNLTPVLIDWIERHFRLVKHRGDYPHWLDAAALR